MAPRGFLRSAAFLLFETRIWLPVKMVRTQLLQEPPSTLSVVTAPGVVQGPLCVHRYCVMGGGQAPRLAAVLSASWAWGQDIYTTQPATSRGKKSLSLRDRDGGDGGEHLLSTLMGRPR